MLFLRFFEFFFVVKLADSLSNEDVEALNEYCRKNQNSESSCNMESSPYVCTGPLMLPCRLPTDSATDPCTFQDALYEEGEGNGNYRRFMSSYRLFQCIDRLELTNANALWSLHSLLYGVVETYSFTDLAKDSLASNHSTTCKFKVHNVTSSLEGEIKKQIASYGRQLEALPSEDAQALFLRQTVPAYDFHRQIAKLFNNLHDAHTVYLPPFSMFRMYSPIGFGSRLEGGRQVVTLKYNDASPRARWYRGAFGDDAIPAYRVGQVVTHIEGLEAMAFLEGLVSENGFFSGVFQGKSQRLNGFLFSAPNFQFSGVTGFPRTNGLTIIFEDGESLFVNWLASHNDFVPNLSIASLDNLNNYINTNPKFHAYISYELVNTPVERDHSTFWRLVASISGEGIDRENEFKALPDSDTQTDMTASAVVGSTVQGDVPEGEEGDADFIQKEGFRYRFQGDAVVVIISSFDVETDFEDFVQVYQEAKDREISRILIDFTGNRGGYIYSFYTLLWYFLPNEDICPVLQKRVSWNWQVWLQSFGVGLEELLDTIYLQHGEHVASTASVKEHVKKLSDVVYMMHDVLSVIDHTDLLAFENYVVAFENLLVSESLSHEERFEFLKHLFQLVAYFLTRSEALKFPEGTWFPFDSLREPRWGAPEFVPPTRPYTDLLTKKWGPEFSRYSRRGEYPFCQPTVRKLEAMFGDVYDKDYWTDIAFLSDGTCGSSCAGAAQQLQLSGRATAFSYGGIADEVVDVGTYAGGNVEEYALWWKHVVAAAKLGDVASYYASDWSRLNSKTWVNLPIPLPTKAAAFFNWNFISAKQMGEEALPRQYYIIPAHKHFNLWPSTSADRDVLYQEIIALDWCDVKRNPQFADEYGICPQELQCNRAKEMPFDADAEEASSTVIPQTL